MEDEILNKAIAILNEKKLKEERFSLCKQAGICPVCGKVLIEVRKEVKVEPFKILGFLTLRHSYSYENVFTVCPINNEHYKHYEYDTNNRGYEMDIDYY